MFKVICTQTAIGFATGSKVVQLYKLKPENVVHVNKI